MNVENYKIDIFVEGENKTHERSANKRETCHFSSDPIYIEIR